MNRLKQFATPLLLLLIVASAPFLNFLIERYEITPGNIAYQLVKPTPTITPIPRQRVEAVFVATHEAKEQSGQDGTPARVPANTPTPTPVNRLYSPPPTLSPNRYAYASIGEYQTDRGEGYSNDLSLKVGSFSQEREDHYAFWQGMKMGNTRRLLQQEYPEVEAYTFDGLRPELLSQVDLFIMTSELVSEEISDFDKLDPSERLALREFVENGGWLLAGLSQGQSGPWDLGTDDARDIAAIFDADIGTELPRHAKWHMAIEPERFTIMNGPWGKVRRTKMLDAVSFTDLGPHAIELIRGSKGDPVVAMIPPSALKDGSGMVLFVNTAMISAPLSQDNGYLFFNFIDLALQAKAHRLGDTGVPDPAAMPTVTITPTALPPMPTRAPSVNRRFVVVRGLRYMTETPLRITALDLTYSQHDIQQALSLLAYEYPESSFDPIPALTAASLAEVDMLLLVPGRGTLFTTEEQQQLKTFVEEGNCAIVVLENAFGMDGLGNEMAKMVSPFGMTITWPKTWDAQKPLMLELAAQSDNVPILDGPWGRVETLTHHKALGITDAGPWGNMLAQNEYGGAIAYIPPRAMSEESGPVMVLSTKAMLSVGYGRAHTDNDILLGNFVEQCHGHIMTTS
ncbi:MAG: hypothetical protein AAF702_05035 [Chloroflexota bacterium]